MVNVVVGCPLMVAAKCMQEPTKNRSLNSNIRYEQCKIGLAQKYDIDEKSAVFIQSSWYSTNISYPRASHFGKISAWLEENYSFFDDSMSLSQSYFFIAHTLGWAEDI